MARATQKIKPNGRSPGVKDEVASRSRARRETQAGLVDVGRHEAGRRRNDVTPHLQMEMVEVGSLKITARQVRRRDPVQAAKLKASLERYGVVKPILINGRYEVIEGHGVFEAAKALGAERIPCVFVDHLDAARQRMLRLALNRLGETGAWDFDELRLEFAELIEFGCDVIDSGFEMAEVDAILLEDEDAANAEEDEEATTPTGPPVSRPSDVWRLGRHRLLQGDARDPASYALLMASGEFARLVLTDVPYNVRIGGHVTSSAGHREFAMATGEMSRDDFAAFLRDALGAAMPHVVDGELIASYIDWRSVDLLIACGRELGLDLLNLVVWAKSNAGQGSLWRSQHELLPVFKKGDAPHVNNVELGRHGRWRSNLWTYAGASSLGSDAREGLALHPTVKPRVMLEDALLDVSQRDEIVIDPFVGSGSTLLAAEATGRICRAIEIDGPYCDVVIRRWRTMTGEDAVLERTGETFAALSAAAPTATPAATAVANAEAGQ
jgi:DNA modification methylase